MASTVPENVVRAAAVAGAKNVYTVKDYYDDLYRELFASSIAGKRLTSEEKTLQRDILILNAKEVRGAMTKTLTEEEGSIDNEDWCGWEQDGLGEGNKPYQSSVSIIPIDETDSYRVAFLNKVKSLAQAKKSSAPSDDRAHYEYIYARCCAALEKF